MAEQLSIMLDDDLAAQVRAAANDDISAWIAQAARERLAREFWEDHRKTTDALGINDPEWMAAEAAAREAARGER
ncbi:hypothetical protein [Longimycelium tulufanense]|nr:hypothetical protein [Longimycelium tulufanense]